MIRNTIFILFFTLVTYSGVTQITKGKLIDSSGNKITYAHVYFAQQKTGTYSDEKGEFQISLTNYNPDDSLVISHINYLTRKINIQAILDREILELVLKVKPNLLQTIKVYPLSAYEVFDKVINSATERLRSQKSFEYFKVYRAALNNHIAFEERSKLKINTADLNQLKIENDSVLSMTVFDMENTNSLGSFNISWGTDSDAIKSLLCLKLLFENSLANGLLELKLSSDSINLKFDTLSIYENKILLGYIAFSNETYLPMEISYDLAKSNTITDQIMSSKLMFRMATKRGLREIKEISFTQRYRYQNDIFIPEFFMINSKFHTKKQGQLETLSFQKIFYPTFIKIGKSQKIFLQPDIY